MFPQAMQGGAEHLHAVQQMLAGMDGRPAQSVLQFPPIAPRAQPLLGFQGIVPGQQSSLTSGAFGARSVMPDAGANAAAKSAQVGRTGGWSPMQVELLGPFVKEDQFPIKGKAGKELCAASFEMKLREREVATGVSRGGREPYSYEQIFSKFNREGARLAAKVVMRSADDPLGSGVQKAVMANWETCLLSAWNAAERAKAGMGGHATEMGKLPAARKRARGGGRGGEQAPVAKRPSPAKVANAIPAGYRATSSNNAAPRDPFASGSEGLSDDTARELDLEVHASDDARAGPPDDLASILAGGGGEEGEEGPWAFKICDRYAPTPSTPKHQSPKL